MHNFKCFITAVAVLVGIGLAGCGDESKTDSQGASGANVDRTAPEVIAMPNDFGNVAYKCDKHGHRVYVTTNPGTSSAANIAVIDDPSCR